MAAAVLELNMQGNSRPMEIESFGGAAQKSRRMLLTYLFNRNRNRRLRAVLTTISVDCTQSSLAHTNRGAKA